MFAATCFENWFLLLASIVVFYFFCVAEAGYSLGKRYGIAQELSKTFCLWAFFSLPLVWWVSVPVSLLWVISKLGQIPNLVTQGICFVALSLVSGILVGSVTIYPGSPCEHMCSTKCPLRAK